MDSNETKIYIALLIIAVALVVIISFFTFTILRHRRRAQRLYQEKVAAEITTLENERKRIASDLHDDLGPLMSAIKLKLSAIDPASEADKLNLQQVGRHIDDVVDKIRTTSNNLVPLVLARKGLYTALDQFAGSVTESGKFQVSIIRDTDVQPAPEQTIHLYRIIQEMINNTIRHAKASRSNIHIASKDGRLFFNVSDDGIGFNFQKLSKARAGFGLQNILSRADILKARIFIDTKPGNGVRYQLELPVSDYEQ
ncbi:MAG TPA: ATP-binding protein [Chitinophagaceae bacterium]